MYFEIKWFVGCKVVQVYSAWRRLLRKLYPEWSKKLNYEIMVHACKYRNEKMPLHIRWRIGELHWLLGNESSPSNRFNVSSSADYRRKLKAQKKIIDEIIDEILAEEKAKKAG
jgi:hypothetical protein